jgi:PucR family transcriptional regulator, purine catabolism regulatory protein
MLTVIDVLESGLLEGAQVVAGHAGLRNRVLWIHNAGVPDAPRWLNGGELVLTTGINIPETVEEQKQYVRDMAAKGVAALAMTIGRYINTIPDHMQQIAEDCAFPLIEIPYTARFVDIARAINERISQENMQMVTRALTIQKELTRVVLEGGGFQHLAQKLAEQISHSISIENDRFDAIATVNIAAVDEARRYTQLHGRTDPRLVEALETRGYLPVIRDSLRPIHLPAMPDVGLEMERILAPIIVHGDVYGFMWVIADDHMISDIDLMAIESGVTIAALIMLYQESMQSAEASLKGSLLSQLIQGDIARETILTDQSMRYGVDLRASYVMMLVETVAGNTQSLTQLYRSVNSMIASEAWHAVAGQFAGEVVLLAQDNEHLRVLAARVQERITPHRTRPDYAARVGVSAVLQGADKVRIAYQQCRDVLHITRRLKRDKRVAYFSEVGYLHALFCAGPGSLVSNPSVPILRRLLDEKQADLFNTLEAYLDEGGNGVSTADTLHIHRSTLNYRLGRIEEIIGIKLDLPSVRMDLQVALKLMRLFEVD